MTVSPRKNGGFEGWLKTWPIAFLIAMMIRLYSGDAGVLQAQMGQREEWLTPALPFEYLCELRKTRNPKSWSPPAAGSAGQAKRAHIVRRLDDIRPGGAQFAFDSSWLARAMIIRCGRAAAPLRQKHVVVIGRQNRHNPRPFRYRPAAGPLRSWPRPGRTGSDPAPSRR